MNLNNSLDFNAICRICLKYESELKSIFHSQAAYMLNFCQLLEVNEHDELPRNICINCNTALKDSYDLKKKCIISYTTLKSFTKNVMQKEQEVHVSDTDILNTEQSVQFSSEQNLIEHVLKDEGINGSNLLDTEETNDNDKIPFDESKTVIQNSDDELTSFLEVRTNNSLPFKCLQCTQSFVEEEDLNLHESTHTTGDLLCVVCNKNFRTRQMFKRHMKIHMIHKPHICQRCGKGYAESHSLTKHMKKHLGIKREKKHFCDECGQGYICLKVSDIP